MAPRTKKRRASKPKPLLKRLANDPTKTTKQEWRKLPPVGKAFVAVLAMGITGIGAREVASMGKVGQAVSPVIAWGAKIRQKLG